MCKQKELIIQPKVSIPVGHASRVIGEKHKSKGFRFKNIEHLSDVGVVVVGSMQPFDGENLPCIRRIYSNYDGVARVNRGVVIGSVPWNPCALAIIVNPGDLIEIYESNCITWESYLYYYKVGNKYDLSQVAFNGDEMTKCKIFELLTGVKSEDLLQIDHHQAAARMMFEVKNPKWLVEIFDKAVEYWREHDPEMMWQLAPSRVRKEEISEVVSKSPYLALGNFKDRLTRKQLSECVKQCPKGAIRFAFEEVSEEQIVKSINIRPDELLDHAANKMTEEHLDNCAMMSPYHALDIRHNLTSRRQAIVLIQILIRQAYPLERDARKNFMAEIIDSMINNMDLWNYSLNVGGLNISNVIEIMDLDISYEQWKFLREILTEDQKHALDQHTASKI